ncbi:MAG: anhydro-N-acetylmuramic acid kinase [Phenylobacterium sp.]|jgi:anhydro-N-acetylmuramic acid kinase
MDSLFIGLMSGTSLDGIDAVLVDFSHDKPQLISSYSQNIPLDLTHDIQQLCDGQISHHEINKMGAVDRQLGQLFAKAVNTLCQQANIDPAQVTAIGSHGQTIRHYPDGAQGFTLQIGDANTIAVQTGIDVIADFRKKDIALGGQGAPLVPAFHQSVFHSNSTNNDNNDRMIVNIGGIANVTFLPGDDSQPISGFDTGPGNTLLDRWIQTHQSQPYEDNGAWARSGVLNQPLLTQLLSDTFFQLSGPKSTGRERFNLDWLNSHLTDDNISSQDVQHTLVHLTAKSLASALKSLASSGEIYLCGGGSRNAFLVSVIEHYLPQFKVFNTEALGVNPDWVEAIAFAWLARAYTLKQPGNVPAVTGASRSAVLGAYFPAD